MLANIAKLILIVTSLLSVFFVHELGHYIVGRLLNLKISEFSIGIGPVNFLPRFTDNRGTVWRLGLLPIGAYVRFMRKEEPADDGGGIIVGLVELLAKLTMFIWQPILSLAKRVYDPTSEKKLRGKYYIDTLKVIYKVPLALIGPVSNFAFSLLLVTGLYVGFGRNPVELVVNSDYGSLQKGDIIQKLNTKKCYSILKTLLVPSSGSMTVIRNEKELDLPNEEIKSEYITYIQKNSPNLSVFGAFKHASQDIMFIVINSLSRLLNIKRTASQLGGIASIVQDGFNKISIYNLYSIIAWTALISIMLGVFNMLIIPPLDGGMALLALIQSCVAKKYRGKTEEIFTEVAFLAILLIFAITLRSDLKMALGIWRK